VLAGLRDGHSVGVGHQHEHCLVSAHRRQQAVLRAAPPSVLLSERPVPFRRSPGFVAAGGVAVLRVAPKQSPPT
jgi:hypothetical protein